MMSRNNYQYYVEGPNEKKLVDIKRDFCSCTNLNQRLQKCGFELEKLWSRQPSGDFEVFLNEAKRIKTINKCK